MTNSKHKTIVELRAATLEALAIELVTTRTCDGEAPEPEANMGAHHGMWPSHHTYFAPNLTTKPLQVSLIRSPY